MFPLGLDLCLSLGIILFLCSLEFAYTVLLNRRDVLHIKGQGGVVAAKFVFHHQRHIASQSTV